MKLYPIKEVWAGAQEWMNQGFDIYQQFQCSNCGVKQTIDTKNRFFTRGKCQECSHETNILKDGCNYMAISGNYRKGEHTV